MTTPTRYDYLANELHRLLSGGDPPADSPWDRRELRLYVEQSHARVVTASYWQELRDTGEHHVDGQLMVTLAGLPLVLNTDLGEQRAALPSAYIALPGGRGIQSVRWSGKPNEPDLPPMPGNGALFRRIPESKALGWAYYTEGASIAVLHLGCGGLPKATKINVRVVMPGASGALPPEQEMATLAEALKLVQARQQPDLTNDHNPKP